MTANEGGFCVPPGEGRAIDLGTFSMVEKASPASTGRLVSVLEASEPAGFGPPMHIHHDAAEAFYVLEGEYTMFLGEREVVCPAGTFIFIPAGLPHGFRVGSVDSRKLNFFFPAAMTGYFDELSAAVARGEADDAVLDDIARAHNMEIIGPVPESYL